MITLLAAIAFYFSLVYWDKFFKSSWEIYRCPDMYQKPTLWYFSVLYGSNEIERSSCKWCGSSGYMRWKDQHLFDVLLPLFCTQCTDYVETFEEKNLPKKL